MNWHPTEDDLILHFYGEHPPDEAGRIDEHLPTCNLCRASWSDLRETLTLVDRAPVPEPGPAFERVIWARVAPALPAAPARRWSFGGVLTATAAVAAAVVLAIAGGTWWAHRAPVPASPAAAATASARTQERMLLTALDGHFDQAQTVLVELLNTTSDDPSGADLTFVRTAADDLIADGRLYRITARRNGETRFVGLLDDLEVALVDVARTSDQMNAADFESLRTRITDANLLFKVRTMANEIKDREKRVVLDSE